MNEIAATYPDIATVSSIGNTYEGRPISMLTISTGGTGKPAILVDAGIHAREWIAPATALYIIQELVENPDNRALIENVDWFIVPVLNPDGYEYSHTNVINYFFGLELNKKLFKFSESSVEKDSFKG